jgi:FlaA1/EpsC-like NDP-sugar epimerase
MSSDATSFRPSDFRDHSWLKATRVFDLVIVCMTFLGAMVVTSSTLTWPGLAQVLVIRVKIANLFLFAGYIALCAGLFLACGLYRSHRLSRWGQRFNEIFLAVTLLTGVLWLLRLPLALEFATDAFLLLFCLLTLCAIVLSHEIARQILYLARRRGRNLRNIIVVGDGPNAGALASRIRQESSLGYRVLRVIDVAEMGEMTENGRPIGDL